MNKLITLLFAASFGFFSMAQSITAEPASFYGLGEMSSKGHGIFDALGKNAINVFDSSMLNHYNPASYNRLSKGATLYTVSIHSRQSWYSNATTQQFAATPMVEQFTLGFKIGKQMGLSFGLRPFSARGYQISEKQFTGLDSIRYNYAGQGAIQDLYAGYSFGLIEKTRTKLAIGANASYLFGTLVNERSSVLLTGTSAAGGLERNSLVIRSFYTEMGSYFWQQLGKNHSVCLSAVYQPQLSIGGDYQRELYSSATIGSPSSYDTILNSSQAFSAQLAQSTQLGLSYAWKLPKYKRQTRELHPQLELFASYSLFGALNQKQQILTGFDQKDYNRMSFGLQYQPEFKVLENIATLKAFEKLTYRVGYYQQTLPYTNSGLQYQEQGLTLGFGLPLLAQVSLSSLNVGLTFGQRTIATGIWKEQFIGARVSLIMAPSNFEKWFRKRQLD
ncbi:MAG: hypothetical protein RLZZ211_444 [Bacteroidota bacterium]|jgi:hypothetical protein